VGHLIDGQQLLDRQRDGQDELTGAGGDHNAADHDAATARCVTPTVAISGSVKIVAAT
jgi:hypothetical protein